MNNRIDFVDNLKGIAILFMVMGHVMQMSLNTSNTPFNLFYTSFHMPIFMFLSGMFIYKKFRAWNIEELVRFILSKIKRILFPFFIFGGLYAFFYIGDITPLFTGQFYGYWFLPALFICMLLDVMLSFIFHMLNLDKSAFSDVLFRLFFWGICIWIYTKWNNPYFRGFLFHYPFFVFGTFYVRYNFVKYTILNSNLCYSLAIVMYIVLWIFHSYIPMGFNLLGFPSIIILIWLASHYNSIMPKVFKIMGINSLEVYVIHRFFVPSLISITPLLNKYMYFDKSQNFVLYIVISMLVSLPICYLSIFIAKIIKESKYLKYICFGFK